MTQQRFTVTHFILDTSKLHRHPLSSFSGKCRLPLWSEMDMRLLLRCAACSDEGGGQGGGKGSWLCRIRRGSPLPPAPVSSVCELYSCTVHYSGGCPIMGTTTETQRPELSP